MPRGLGEQGAEHVLQLLKLFFREGGLGRSRIEFNSDEGRGWGRHHGVWEVGGLGVLWVVAVSF